MSRIIQVISGPQEGRAFLVRPGETLGIGRGQTNDVVISHDSYISTNHATVTFDNSLLVVCDLKSSNGSFIEGYRIKPNAPEVVNNFFVLGSTVFSAGGSAKNLKDGYQQPEPLEGQAWNKYLIIKRAADLCQENRSFLVNSQLLFVAFLECHPEIAVPFLKHLGISSSSLLKKWSTSDVFDPPYHWLNSFIRIQHKPGTFKQVHMTPKAKRLFLKELNREKVNPVLLLKDILEDDFNLVFPLLDWEKTHDRWSSYFDAQGSPTVKKQREKTTKKPTVPTLENGIVEALTSGKVVVLRGNKGCGKTGALTRLIDKTLKKSNPYPELGEAKLFDPRAFLAFNQAKHLKRLIKRIISELGKPGLVIIDHMADMLAQMEREILETDGLTAAINSRANKTHVILVADSGDPRFGNLYIHGSATVDAGYYMAVASDEPLAELLKVFSKNTHCAPDDEAESLLRDYYENQFGANPKRMRVFLDSCEGLLRAVDDRALTNLTTKTGTQSLTPFFYETAMEEWGEVTQTISREPSFPTPPPLLEVVPEPEPETTPEQPVDLTQEAQDFILQIEHLIQTFVMDEFKIGLNYSDKTRSVKNQRFLSETEKLQELKAHLVYILEGFKVGFQRWFASLWDEIAPEAIQGIPKIGANPKKLWQAFLERAGRIDHNLAEDQFIESVAKSFADAWRSSKK